MSGRRLTLTVLAVFFLILIIRFSGFLKTPETLLRQTAAPLIQTAYRSRLALADFYQRHFSRQNFFEQNQQCLNQLNNLLIDRAKLETLKEENQSLSALLNFSKKGKKKVIVEVIGRPSDQSSKAVLINRGSDDNIKEGNAVIVEEGLLLGKVIRVEKDISAVQLITDNRSKIAAAVLNDIKTIGVVNGEHGISLKMTMIPLNETIQINDIVVTSGLEQDLPRGLIIGRVETIAKELYAPFQTALLQPLTNLNKTSIAAVLIE